METQDFKLAEWSVRTESRLLTGPDGSHQLTPRTIGVLLHLARHAGKVRSRDDILTAVWGDAIVGEEVLSHCIWELRRALGDNSRKPRFIQTIHRKGYKLIAPVSWLEEPTAQIASPTSEPLQTGRGEKGLELLRERVHRFWIDQVLTQSLGGVPPYRLAFEPRPDAVDHPWGQLRPTTEEAQEEVKPEEPLPTTLRRLGGSLLILGEAGSGKTVTLLRLAQQTIERGREDPMEPVPVVIQLASWADETRPFEDWLEEQISRRYYVPRAAAKTWIHDGVLMVLLDGLDEVEASRRTNCVASINRFHEAMPSVPLVITCRAEDYQNLTLENTRLVLGAGLAVMPLTESQVATALADAPGLRQRVERDQALGELAGSPLILNILRRFGLGDADSEGNPETTDNEKLLYRLIRGSLRAQGKAYPPYSERQTVDWLAGLAQSMLGHHSSLFQLEELQPSWLRSRWRRWVYVFLSRLGISLCLCASFLWIFWVVGRPEWQPVILLGGAFFGVGVAFLDLALLARRSISQEGRAWSYSLLIAIVGVTTKVSIQQAVTPTKFPAGSIFFVLCLATILRRRLSEVRWETDVTPVETLRWSWHGALRGMAAGTAAFWILNVIIGLARGHVVSPVDLFSLLPNGVIGGLIAVSLFSLRPGLVDLKTRPNHGMWLSARNAALGAGLYFSGTFVALLLARLLVLGGLLGPTHVVEEIGLRPDLSMLWGLSLGMALVGAINLGGVELIKHFVLRCLLATEGATPIRFPRFLEYAARCRLLRRAGGGYIFAHRSLQEYFAALRSDRQVSPPPEIT